MKEQISIPEPVQYLLDTLERHGWEAYVVGGCVRDSLLGKPPHDWDICTAAPPDETARCFPADAVIETGLRHGTLTILLEGNLYEITTFRKDGAYADHRRPDTVEFVSDLRTDLSRRDFTVNAMAYHPVRGLCDPFGGISDLAAGLLRCVGEPARRFHEDALRILRALRFASCYGFQIEPETARALLENRALLSGIAAERVSAELCRLLCGMDAQAVLESFAEVFAVCVPELQPMRGFVQHTPHHCHDVWEHTTKSVGLIAPERVLRLTMLLHDIGKPSCFTRDAHGTGHFYGHEQQSAVLAEQILRRLKLDGETIRQVTELIRRHMMPLEPNERAARRWLNRLGERQLRNLIAVKRADMLAQSNLQRAEKRRLLEEFEHAVDAVLKEKQCFSLRELAVNGRDLIAAGISEGKAIGDTLDYLLELVLNGEAENDRGQLLQRLNQH